LTLLGMTSPARFPTAVHHQLSPDAFADAQRVVFEQVKAFSVAPDFVVPGLTGVSPEVHGGTPDHSRLDCDYYDTAGLDLADDGVALRWEGQSGEWTAVLPAESITGQPIRCEASYPGTGDAVPGPVNRLLHLYLHERPLEYLARVVSRRLTRPLLSRSGLRLADVIDENVEATRDDGAQRRYRTISVEVRDLDGLGRKVIADVCARLASAGCDTVAPTAEPARAFGVSPHRVEPL
jgi:hypothetical protein